MESLLVRNRIRIWKFVDINDDGSDDGSYDDDWLCKSDVGSSICEDNELVFELFLSVILSKGVSFKLIEHCSSPDSLST